MTIYEMTKDLPAFKSYSKRRINGKSKSMVKILADARKKQASAFKAFCRPRGLLSILVDNEYTTGRHIRRVTDCEHDDVCEDCRGHGYSDVERLKLRKKGNDIISEAPDPETTPVYQDDLLLNAEEYYSVGYYSIEP